MRRHCLAVGRNPASPSIPAAARLLPTLAVVSLLAGAAVLGGCSKSTTHYPVAPATYTISGRVTLYLSARSSDGTSLGRIPVVDRDSVAVDLILDNNLAGSVRTVAGSYQFTGLGSGFYRAVARVVGTVADTAWISRHEPGGATVDTLELGHTGDLEMVPNPVVSGGSITFTLQAATTATATLKIVTVGGSVVRTLLNQSMEPGAHQVTWDGLDDHGQTVAAGVYWLLFNRDSDYRADLIRKL